MWNAGSSKQWSYSSRPQSLLVYTGRKELTLSLQERELSSQALKKILTPRLRSKLHAQLEELEPGAAWHYINVDASCNDLGPAGALILVEFLHECASHDPPVFVRDLRMYRNHLGD